MKKIVCILIALTVFTSSIFAKNRFFDSRFLELEANIPMQISNNYFSYGDIKTGEDLVIDLEKMADTLPASGLESIAAAQMNTGIRLNLFGCSIGAFVGLDLTGKVNIGKDLFDFLGKGYAVGEEAVFDMDLDMDVFLTSKVPVSLDIRRLQVCVEPTLFVPLVNMSVVDARAVAQNTNDGLISVNGSALLNVYSIADYTTLYSKETGFCSSEISNVISDSVNGKYFGFDLGGSFNYRLSDMLMITSGFQIPIVPGTLSYSTAIKGSFEYETTLMDAMQGNNPDGLKKEFSVGEVEKVERKIHRPLKFNIGAQVCPFCDDWFTVNMMAGVGIKHPFSKLSGDIEVFPEYKLGANISLASILKANLMTACIDQSFIQQAGFGVSIRFIELNAGVSTQGVSFYDSLRGRGLGAYVTINIGI